MCHNGQRLYVAAREAAVNRAALPLQVDRNSPVPLCFQVAQHVEQLIESGDLAPGTRLENETDLAGQLGLSRPAI
jgi:DNA-binding GntR family transcriptional regulator